jgi:hypothetical protein
MAVTGSCLARPFRHVSWRVRSVTLDRQLTASSTVIPLPSPSEFGPSASVRAAGWCAPRTSSAAQDARGRDVAHEAEALLDPRVVSRNIAPTRAGSVSSWGQAWRDAVADGGVGVMAGVIRITPFCYACGSHGVGPFVPSAHASASTNTASTAGPRTLRICACDRSSCPRAG